MGAFLHSRGSFWRQNDKKTRFSFYKEMREKKVLNYSLICITGKFEVNTDPASFMTNSKLKIGWFKLAKKLS